MRICSISTIQYTVAAEEEEDRTVRRVVVVAVVATMSARLSQMPWQVDPFSRYYQEEQDGFQQHLCCCCCCCCYCYTVYKCGQFSASTSCSSHLGSSCKMILAWKCFTSLCFFLLLWLHQEAFLVCFDLSAPAWQPTPLFICMLLSMQEEAFHACFWPSSKQLR
jgi:hypothetical protein